MLNPILLFSIATVWKKENIPKAMCSLHACLAPNLVLAILTKNVTLLLLLTFVHLIQMYCLQMYGAI